MVSRRNSKIKAILALVWPPALDNTVRIDPELNMSTNRDSPVRQLLTVSGIENAKFCAKIVIVRLDIGYLVRTRKLKRFLH